MSSTLTQGTTKCTPLVSRITCTVKRKEACPDSLKACETDSVSFRLQLNMAYLEDAVFIEIHEIHLDITLNLLYIDMN